MCINQNNKASVLRRHADSQNITVIILNYVPLGCACPYAGHDVCSTLHIAVCNNRAHASAAQNSTLTLCDNAIGLLVQKVNRGPDHFHPQIPSEAPGCLRA